MTAAAEKRHNNQHSHKLNTPSPQLCMVRGAFGVKWLADPAVADSRFIGGWQLLQQRFYILLLHVTVYCFISVCIVIVFIIAPLLLLLLARA